MDQELSRLRRDVRALKLYAVAITGILAIALFGAFRPDRADDQVLRARGLVIVDDAGRERILIGAPIPAAAGRVRTDTARVRAIWGPRFPAKYMEYYRSYRHSMNGMLVLDEHGFDRLAVGDSVPDPNIGRRIGPSTGIAINDAQGFERSGYGLIRAGGRDRVVIGLDDARGREGVALMVADSGDVCVLVQHGADGRIYLGHSPDGDPFGRSDAGFMGLALKQGEHVRRLSATDSR